MKCVIVGQPGVGKSSLLLTFLNGEFPEDSDAVPDVLEDGVDVQQHAATLWDTGTDRSNRKNIYPQARCYILAFSLVDRASLHGVFWEWYNELHDYSPRVPLILVGLKKDLVAQADVENVVSSQEALRVCRKIHARGYFEMSSRTREGLDALFAAGTTRYRVYRDPEDADPPSCPCQFDCCTDEYYCKRDFCPVFGCVLPFFRCVVCCCCCGWFEKRRGQFGPFPFQSQGITVELQAGTRRVH